MTWTGPCRLYRGCTLPNHHTGKHDSTWPEIGHPRLPGIWRLAAWLIVLAWMVAGALLVAGLVVRAVSGVLS